VPEGQTRFGLIDSLRAVAALSIVLYHVLLFAGAANHDVTLAAQSQLVAGLALFFVISGFLLYRPFVVALSRADRNPDLRAYAWRRFLRIVPAYWVAVTVTGLITAPEVFEKPLVFYGFAQTLSLETNTQGVSVAWTLCLEVMFYAFLPFYALAIRGAAGRLGQWRAEALGLATLVAAALAWRVGGDVRGIDVMQLNTLPSVLDWFAAGMGLAVVSSWVATLERPPRAIRFVSERPGLWWALALGVLVLEATVLRRRILLQPEFGGWGLMAVHEADVLFAALVVLPAVFVGAGQGWGQRALATRTLVWLGVVSYGTYLWQGLVFELLHDAGLRQSVAEPTLWWIPLGVAGAVGAGALRWYVVERPAMSLRRLVPRRRESRAVEEAEADAVAVAP
jgi:peptidoglycan/LPS O-acetylase OafA/YrhL